VLALFACLPFIVAFTLFSFKIRSWIISFITLYVTCLLAEGVFGASVRDLLPPLASGSVMAMKILIIIGPAFLFYFIEEKIGAVRYFTAALMRLCPEREILVLVIVLGVSPFLEALCGFGTGLIVALPVLLVLGLSPIRVALLSILGEITTAWASMGNAATLEAAISGTNAHLLGMDTALLLIPLTLGSAVLALFLSGGREALCRKGCMAVLAGGLLAGSEWGLSWLVGVDLAGLCASLLVLGALLGYAHLRPHRDPLQAHLTVSKHGQKTERQWKMIVPGAFLLSSLLVVHLFPLPLPLLHATAIWLCAACIWGIICTPQRWNILPEVGRSLWKRLFPIAATILGCVLASAVMQGTGMIDALSHEAEMLGQVYLWVVPLLGGLGAWMTNSNVGSNALFAPMHVEMAQHASLNLTWLSAAQNASASIGRLLAPSCLLLAASSGISESSLFRWVSPIVFLALAGCELVLSIVFLQSGASSLVWVIAWSLLFILGGSLFLFRVSRLPLKQNCEQASVRMKFGARRKQAQRSAGSPG